MVATAREMHERHPECRPAGSADTWLDSTCTSALFSACSRTATGGPAPAERTDGDDRREAIARSAANEHVVPVDLGMPGPGYLLIRTLPPADTRWLMHGECRPTDESDMQAGQMAADDYAWFTSDPANGIDFCLTFAHGLEPDEILAQLDGTEPVEIPSMQHVDEAAHRLYRIRDGSIRLALVAAAAVSDWTMLIEPNQFLITVDSVIRMLSERGELVSLSFNENASPRFIWARRGEVVAAFDPTDPVRRTGTDPDRLAEELARVGFEPGPGHSLRYQQHTLALTEHLTGIRLTPDLLDTTVFRCSAAPVPWGPRPTQKILTAAHQELKRHAEEPGRDELLDHLWAKHGVADKRLRASGHLGVVLYTNANEAFRFLAACDDKQLSEVIRWGRERVFTEAELTNQSWFEPLRQALLRGEPIPPADRASAERHLDPDPGLPPFDTHGRVLLGARQHVAMGLLDEPEIEGQLAVACRVAIALGDVFGGRSDLMVQELLRAFPGFDDA